MPLYLHHPQHTHTTPIHRDALPGLLTRLRLQHGDIQVVATPRRVAVVVDALAAKQPDVEERIRGPPVKVWRGLLLSWERGPFLCCGRGPFCCCCEGGALLLLSWAGGGVRKVCTPPLTHIHSKIHPHPHTPPPPHIHTKTPTPTQKYTPNKTHRQHMMPRAPPQKPWRVSVAKTTSTRPHAPVNPTPRV